MLDRSAHDGLGSAMPGVAGRLGVTDRHLRRIFAQVHGVSPIDYLTTRPEIDPAQGSIAFAALNSNVLYGSAAGATALRSALTRPRTHLFENDLRVNRQFI